MGQPLHPFLGRSEDGTEVTSGCLKASSTPARHQDSWGHGLPCESAVLTLASISLQQLGAEAAPSSG